MIILPEGIAENNTILAGYSYQYRYWFPLFYQRLDPGDGEIEPKTTSENYHHL